MNDSKLATQEFRLRQWKGIIQDRIDSGLKIEEYCNQHGISSNAYYYWLRKIKLDILKKQALQSGHDHSLPEESSIVEICDPTSVVSDSGDDYNDSIPVNRNIVQSQITLSVDGVTISVSDNTSVELISRVIRAVRHA